MSGPSRFSLEQKARAVRMVLEALHGEIGLIPPAEKEADYYAQPPALVQAGSQ